MDEKKELEEIRKELKDALEYKRLFGLSGVKSRRFTETAISMLDALKDKEDIYIFELRAVEVFLNKALNHTSTRHYAKTARNKFDDAHQRLKTLIENKEKNA